MCLRFIGFSSWHDVENATGTIQKTYCVHGKEQLKEQAGFLVSRKTLSGRRYSVILDEIKKKKL